MKTLFILTFCIFFGGSYLAQKDTVSVKNKKDTTAYDRKKEIAFDGKRYRVYNNWLSVGAGANYNTKWPKDERNIGVDFSFHLKKNYFIYDDQINILQTEVASLNSTLIYTNNMIFR